MFQRVFFEKPHERSEKFQDLTLSEALTFLPVILLILGMGIFPQTFIEKIEPTAQLHIAEFSTMAKNQLADTALPIVVDTYQKN
jgi:NADH-quinone oxidoreductase subunit M